MKSHPQRKTYTALLGILAAAWIAGCSSVQKAEYSPNSNPSEEISRLGSDIDRAVGQQHDVIAPTDITRSQKHLTQAKQTFQDQGEMADFWDHMALSRGYLNQAQAVFDKRSPKAQEVLAAREKAMTLDVRRYPRAARELAALDDSLKRNAGDLDRSRLDQDKWDLIRRNYEVLAINTQQEAQVGEARDLIAKAKARGARTYAPMALRQAEKDLAAADRAIATTPDDETAFTPAVNRANASARDLLTINAAARRAAGQTNEEVAVELEGRNRTIAGLRGELQGAELEAAVAGQALAGKDAQLRGVAAANRSLRSEQEWNDAIEQVRGEFSEDEADVYRQGDKLLIRLKKIGFATGSADVPEQSREILSKVGSVISELNAKNVEVQGHTDSTGGPAINQKISKERARAVAEYLEDDVDDINVKAVGYGFERPIVENKSKAGRATNRRVDVVIEPARK